MTDLTKLKAEIDLPAYSGMTDAQILTALNDPAANTPAIIGSRHVNFRTVLAECDGAGAILDKLETAAATIPDVKWALLGIKSDTGIDIGHAKTRAQVDALVSGGVLTATEGDALKDMAPVISRAQQIGLGAVTAGDVAYVRGLV